MVLQPINSLHLMIHCLIVLVWYAAGTREHHEDMSNLDVKLLLPID